VTAGPDASSERATLAADLLTAAVLRGHFTLRSGATSTYYIDKYRLTTEPGLLMRIADAFVALMPDGVQRVAGTALGAVPLATALSLQTGLPSLFVRVDAAHSYGTGKSVEGVLETGDRVLLVEDVVTTGGASVTAVELLQAAGATVLAVVAVVDREQGGGQRFADAGIPFHALFTVTELGLAEAAS
jgi:orotate phosphoribosyltransferase